jgi:hypothetical protein
VITNAPQDSSKVTCYLSTGPKDFLQAKQTSRDVVHIDEMPMAVIGPVRTTGKARSNPATGGCKAIAPLCPPKKKKKK